MKFRRRKKKLLLVTRRCYAETVARRIQRFSSDEYDLTGPVFCETAADNQLGAKTNDAADILKTSVSSMVHTANIADASKHILRNWVDEVLIWFPKKVTSWEALQIRKLLRNCNIMGVTAYVAWDSKNEMDTLIHKRIGGLSVKAKTRSPETLHNPNQLYMKRGLDILGALVGLGMTVLLIPAVSIMIFSTDPGPVFFKQTRIGKNGRPFTMYKFRSMYQNAESKKQELMNRNKMKGFMFKLENDPRILGSGPDGTKKGVGWFLRKSSIDEFPQFFSVIKGDLSLVGSRPPTQDEWNHYDYHHRARLCMRPGITGRWQVSGRSNIRNFEKVVSLDMEYIRDWTIRKDIAILLKTVGLVLTGHGAQ